MPRFSVYLIDHGGDTETSPTIVDVPTDAEAMICAAAIARKGTGAEVWDKSRLVCRVPGGRQSSTAPLLSNAR